jgi:hypothetical protein
VTTIFKVRSYVEHAYKVHVKPRNRLTFYGNDILLFPENVPIIKQSFQDSLFTEKRLEYSVKKI